MTAAAGAWVWMVARPHGGHADVRWTGTMVAAMMLPLTIPHVRHVAQSSLWRRRHRGIAGFLAGYVAVWMLAMMAIVAALGLGSRFAGWTVVAGVVTAAAVLWEVAPGRRRLLHRCTRTVPLAPRGWRADADCARFGVLAGVSCVSVCWALMAACVVFSHSLGVMAVLFGVQLSGRYRRDPSPVLAAVAVLGVCLAALAAQLSGGHHHG
jgi:predicted metal-binding membrane protein